MNKLQYWYIVVAFITFGVGDRIINSILKNYSVESLIQILVGAILLLLVNQLYPYNLGDK